MLLSKLRTKKIYTKSNTSVKNIINKVPIIGSSVIKLVQKTKRSIKQLIIPKMFFEDIGFRYLGPVDGNDIEKLESLLKISKELEGPILIHVITKKGKGYKFAEEKPDKFHATPSFDIKTGEPKNKKQRDYSNVFGEKLVELARTEKNIVAITAAMKDGTGLNMFQKEFPNRFFDVGIAEQHAIGLAAGLAKAGMIPVVPIYSTFYQRAFDQVIHDVCIQKLPVIMCADRAGIVGADGETHQGILDLSFFNIIPNITIMAPKDYYELEKMLEFAVKENKPVVIRYPRGKEGENRFKTKNEIILGKSEIIKYGKDLTIIAIGKMVDRAMDVSNRLKEKDIDVEIINLRFMKPLDEENILKSITKTKRIITIEDNMKSGGISSVIKELLVDYNLQNIEFKSFGYPNEFIKHGSVQEIEEKYGLDTKSICKEIERGFFNDKTRNFKRI